MSDNDNYTPFRGEPPKAPAEDAASAAAARAQEPLTPEGRAGRYLNDHFGLFSEYEAEFMALILLIREAEQDAFERGRQQGAAEEYEKRRPGQAGEIPPTQDAYDAACAALRKHKAREAKLREALESIAARAESTVGTRDGAYYRALIWIREHARAALVQFCEVTKDDMDWAERAAREDEEIADEQFRRQGNPPENG